MTAITPMFSAYVVTPVPPTLPETMVAKPSAINARPMYGFISCPVMPCTARRCPRFSATKIKATGAITEIADIVNVGEAKWGKPNHAALATLVKSTAAAPCSPTPQPKPLVNTAYKTVAKITPTKINKRRIKPVPITAVNAITSTVISIYHALALLPFAPSTATPAKFKPITATTAPVTTGGMRVSIQFVPTNCTNKPIRKYTKPQTIIAPSATPMLAFAPEPA